MKRKNCRLKGWSVIVLCLAACCLLCVPAFAEEYTVEEDGSKWYADGHIEWADGTVTQQVDHDAGQKYEDEGTGTGTSRTNSDGSITIDTGESDPIPGAKRNEDGSIEIESGQGGVDIQDSPTRAPIEGEQWQALLNSVAVRNGAETPTVWIDPASGKIYPVTVTYMGIGRSRVTLNGTEMLVNTVDLKWETTAPEDKVLAAVKAPRVGYAWMRKQPSSKITNPKILQIRTDAVMRVIGTGSNWTFVDYEGMRAYVQTEALEFFANDHTDFDAGYLSSKGKITGKDTVHARSRDKGCRDLGEYKIGTPITVFDIIDEWAEVDICGWHGRVLSKYVTLEKELITADSSR